MNVVEVALNPVFWGGGNLEAVADDGLGLKDGAEVFGTNGLEAVFGYHPCASAFNLNDGTNVFAFEFIVL